MMGKFVKDPQAVLDFMVDWSPWLAEDDTIATATFIPPDGMTVDSSSHDDTTATAWLSGGTAGMTYRVINRITTTGGRTDERSLIMNIREL